VASATARATAVTLTPTSAGATQFSPCIAVPEFSGGDFDWASVQTWTADSGGSNVNTFSITTGTLDDQPRLCGAIGSIRRANGSITWDATNTPSNDLGQLDPSSFQCRTGWEEKSATSAFTWEVDYSSGSAQACMVIFAVPEDSGGATGSGVPVARNPYRTLLTR